jgi:hypothetical protein
MHKNVKRIALGSVGAVWAIIAIACSGDDENPAVPRADAGVLGEGASTATGTGTGNMPTAAMCGRYGNATGIAGIADNIMSSVQMDCRLSGAFANLNGDDQKHLKECFELQIESFFGCPGVTYVGGMTQDSNGNQCRSMRDAHQGMNLRQADFDAFREITINELTKAGVSMDDQVTINSELLGTQSGVVQTNKQPDKNTYCTCPNGINPETDASCVVIIDGGYDGPYESGTTMDSGTDTGSSSSMDASDSG